MLAAIACLAMYAMLRPALSAEANVSVGGKGVPTHKGITLVNNGRTSYRIVVATDADPSVRAAASELQLHLEQMTGVKLEIVDDSQPEQECEILIGASRRTHGVSGFEARAQSIDLSNTSHRAENPETATTEGNGFGTSAPLKSRNTASEPECWSIKTVRTKLIIAGGPINGALNGVYTFLEYCLGVRWYAPDCTVVPKRKTLRVGPLDMKGAPAFEARMTISTNAENPDWAARMRLNGLVPGSDPRFANSLRWAGGSSHSLAALLPVDQYFDEHPEYYSEIDGKRIKDYTQVCTTNPDATRIITEHAVEWVGEHPGARMLSVTANDWNNQCECADCRASDENYGVTGTWLRFVNAIAEGIEKEDPNVIVDTFAYTWTVKPPKGGVKPRRNVAIRYAPIESCSYHEYDDPKCVVNVEQHTTEYLRTWADISPRLWVWYYILEGAPLHPYPALNCLSHNVKLIRDSGGKGFSFLQNRPYAPVFYMHNLKSYLCAKVMWDPDFDVQKGIDEFCKAYYGPAGKAMAAYVRESQDEKAYQRGSDGNWLQPGKSGIAVGVPERVESVLWFTPWNGIIGKPGFHIDFVSSPAPTQVMLRKWFRSFERMEKSVADDPTLLRRVRTERIAVLWCCLLYLPPDDPIRRQAQELFLPMALEVKLPYMPDLRKPDKYWLTPENVELLKQQFPEFCPSRIAGDR